MKSINPFKVFTVIIVGFLLLMTCMACTSLKTFNTRPAGCEQSVIYDYVPYPTVVSILEADSIAKIVANNPALKPYLVKFYSDMLRLINSPVDRKSVTYFDIGKLAVDQTKWANGYVGMIVLALSQILTPFDKPIPLTECDRNFLVVHFQRGLDALGGVQ